MILSFWKIQLIFIFRVFVILQWQNCCRLSYVCVERWNEAEEQELVLLVPCRRALPGSGVNWLSNAARGKASLVLQPRPGAGFCPGRRSGKWRCDPPRRVALRRRNRACQGAARRNVNRL